LKVASLVHNHFTNDSRVEKQATTLVKSGYDLTVFGLWDKGLFEEEAKVGFKVIRIKLLSASLKGSIGRFIKFIEFSCKVSWKIKKMDVVHCHDYHPLPATLLASLVFRSNFRIIYDAHEYESQKLGLGETSKVAIRVLEKLSSHFIDGFITVSDSIMEAYEKIFPRIPRTLILNCPPKWKKSAKNIYRKKFNITEQSLVGLYQGGFMPGRAISIMLEAFESLEAKNVDFVFMGYPASTQPSRDTFSLILKKSEKSKNIHFHEPVSTNSLQDYTSSADVGLCLIEDYCLSYRFCLPNKFFEYAMAELPVLVSDLPEMRKLVEEYNCGVICESLTPEGVVKGVKELLNKDLEKLGKNARRMAEDHSWEAQEEKLINLYDRVLMKKAS
jgi:glycosyltransferase involved in cell wall biosynthesis